MFLCGDCREFETIAAYDTLGAKRFRNDTDVRKPIGIRYALRVHLRSDDTDERNSSSDCNVSNNERANKIFHSLRIE